MFKQIYLNGNLIYSEQDVHRSKNKQVIGCQVQNMIKFTEN